MCVSLNQLKLLIYIQLIGQIKSDQKRRFTVSVLHIQFRTRTRLWMSDYKMATQI